MADRPPEFIASWLEQNLHRFDGPSQLLGTEPNAVRRPWESTTLRWLIAASWPYMQSAGNMAIPAVYDTIHRASPQYLCDRFYLPATPKDMSLLERGGIPVFGIESRHPVHDFDVFGTSISYPVLFMNLVKHMAISGIPLRRREREEDAGNWPMVIVGGLADAAPEFMSAAVDCVYLGEVEDEPGNPGLGAVCGRIAEFKAAGDWQADRPGCYDELAKEFNYLYFPRTMAFEYAYEDRGLPHPSRQVSGYRPVLDGMRVPFRVRKVHDLSQVALLTEWPLLLADPGMGSGDVEAGRGSVAGLEYVLIHGQGLRRLDSWQGDDLHPHGADLGTLKCDSGGRQADVSHVLMNGERRMVTVRTVVGHELTCTPDHEVSVVRGPAVDARCPDRSPARGPREFTFSHGHGGKPSRLETFAERGREFVRADELVPGRDYVPVYYGQNVWAPHEQALVTVGCHSAWSGEIELPSVLDEDVAWLLGMLAGDVTVDNKQASHTYALRIQAEDPGVAARTAQVLLRLFGRDIEPWTRTDARPGRQTFVLQSVALIRWLEINFGVTGNRDRRRVPELILRSPRHVVAAYISGFYDSDGSYDDRTGRPSWVSSSEELIRVVSLLLLNLGAPCARRVAAYSGLEDHRGFTRRQDCWRIQGLQAPDGDWAWLQPSHTRRLVHLRRWQQRFSSGTGKEASAGVIYAPVREVDTQEIVMPSYDLAVPEYVSFTCSGTLVHNCTAWCSFCKESLVRKPYRQEPVENTVGRAREIRLNQGSLEMSPFAPNMPVHTRKRELLGALLETVSDEVDTSSLRIDDFNSDEQYALIQVTGGADSLTFGLEGNSQRTRDLVGKGCSDDDVLRAVGQAIRGGIRKIKLYMITNLPGEDPADVMRIVTLGQRLAALRESLGVPGVRIQFSWTPWLNEAQTPMQWFAPTPPDYTLQQAMDQLRDTGIAFKIGTKAQPWKLAFFQACQRASREVGEAILDVLEELGTASWGGFPRDMKERLDAGLARHGFRNGLDDIFGERFRGDLLGWEHIDTGVSRRLLWDVYRQMTEFLEGTDPESYEAQFDERYHGNEWVAKCDQACQGRKCGACGVQDLRLRKEYIKAADGERDYAAQPVRKLDQTTVACRLRVRLDRPEPSRFISAESFPFIIRRAAYRAAGETGFPAIAKRTVALASAPWKYRDWTTGTEYAEFGITRPVTGDGAAEFLTAMAVHLRPWLRVAGTTDAAALPAIPWSSFQVLPAEARMPRGPSLWELEVSDHPALVAARIRDWGDAAAVPVLVRSESFYAGVQTEPGNAKDHVGDFWLARDGHRYLLRMVLTGKLGPYQAAAALLRKSSWIDTARHTARRVEFFDNADPLGGSLFRPACTSCGRGIPASLLGELFDGDYCPRCQDEAAGTLVAGLARAGV